MYRQKEQLAPSVQSVNGEFFFVFIIYIYNLNLNFLPLSESILD